MMSGILYICLNRYLVVNICFWRQNGSYELVMSYAVEGHFWYERRKTSSNNTKINHFDFGVLMDYLNKFLIFQIFTTEKYLFLAPKLAFLPCVSFTIAWNLKMGGYKDGSIVRFHHMTDFQVPDDCKTDIRQENQ